MIHPRKPVWTEGLFMTPQHLQQGDQYHESLLQARTNALLSYPWGVTGVQFDERALAAGQLKLVKCHGFFPDGTPFFVGDRGEDVVEARPLEGVFPAALEALDVFVAIPNVRETHPNVALDPAKANPAIRFVAATTTVPDLTTGRNDTSVVWARYNLRILFGTEPRDAYQTVRIGQLVRDRTGAIVLKKSFIPPIPHIGSSDHIMSGMRRILSAMVGKQKSLAEGRRLRTAASVDFQFSDTAKFWMLHTLNAFIPAVSHMVDHGNAHPEDCYVLIASLIGELCTFAADGDPTSIPKFNYLDLEGVFEPLFDRALTLVASVLAENYTVVPLEKREDGMYLGKFEDPKLPRTHELFLEAKGADEATLRERLPRLLKMGSWTQIGYILNAAMPGVRVAVEYRPPGAIPVKPGVIYLRVDQAGDYWNDILGSGTIAIYQPIDPQKVDLRLIAVQGGK
ncbi:type VI secretion system baseplate subunit TssK [Polyangium jinanense]|uniref:Type VI secretion system baseplate subunit TssK n=1 Tax=Polyangium jinanense TaxID=2829994 RepID=A0A9X3XCL9_9BACT|nr:type VI secretion system baseplate subunit TssK [Polyangium jinanense]MDC3956525.1 type VI secretion system baseplate subunit TssK [Polyangium jinanense]MDC3985556.1 type VI secretion system baseplate subunit TssK [Polyangium jinanense]